MDKKNTGLIATIATVILCGCPGLFLCFFGGTFSLVGVIPGSDIDINGSSDPTAAVTLGIVFLCVSLILIAIPVLVGFFTLRKKPAEAEAAPISDEPLPPTS